jgi:predicted enzyme related to lactoylglutathione lyase
MKKSAMVAVLGLSVLAEASFAGPRPDGRRPAAQLESFSDSTGVFETLSSTGAVDRHSAFFQSLGTNGRSCGTCHVPDQAFALSAAAASETFRLTQGWDPLFAPVDGANCPNVRRNDAATHSLLLKHGLFRISIPLPASAEFTITVIHDPYGCAIMLDPKTGQEDISVYRRPLPATNLSFLSDVMTDGRETIASLSNGDTFLVNLQTDLKQQASDATTGHAQALKPPSDEQLAEIVSFELGLHTAQSLDLRAGPLMEDGALGGAIALSAEEYFPGINDARGNDPTGTPFDPSSMTLFAAWDAPTTAMTPQAARRDAARAAVAAGEKIFATATLITGGGGVTHCSTCHDTPNVGDRSLSSLFDIGTSHSTLPSMESDPQISAALAELSMPDLPVYLLSGCPDTADPTQTTAYYTSDPGRALITGKCSDVYHVKVPVLRGLAARGPYFHNGAAADLSQVVDFYDQRFQMGLTPEQKSDLVAFLTVL